MISLLVAEEVLQAERGGQWLLSCYGPFKEKKCIPGMDDYSPEEIRWEMYQAQKNGTADQVVRYLYFSMAFADSVIHWNYFRMLNFNKCANK